MVTFRGPINMWLRYAIGITFNNIGTKVDRLSLFHYRRASGSSVKSAGNGTSSGGDAARLIRKAKRPNRDRAYSVSEGGKFGSGSTLVPVTGPARVLKNSRKSRNGMGRGLPKKGKVKSSFVSHHECKSYRLS